MSGACVVVLDLGPNAPSFLASNLRLAAERHESEDFRSTAAALRDLAAQADGQPPTPRSLVVIDPEDRKVAVDIAQRAASAAGVDPGVDISAVITAVQAALREFANPKPPKPDEPTGLGAVVEDAKGLVWIRWSRGEGAVWRSPDVKGFCAAAWSHVADAGVTVLSEGVRDATR